MWSVLSACALLQVLSLVSSATIPEALHYIGAGYNVINGNPDGRFWASSGDDPGLLSTRKILTLSSGDVPSEVVYEYHATCRHAQEVAFFHDPKSYQDKLLERVSSTGTNNDAVVGSAFSLSKGYKAVEQQTRRDFYVFQDEQSTCTSGSARFKESLSQAKHYGLTEEFVTAVCRLPVTYDKAVFQAFVDEWGTHVITGVEMGSKTIRRYVAPVKDFVEFVMANSSRDVSIGGSFMSHASSLVVDLNAYKYRTQYRTIVGQLYDTLEVGTQSSPEPIGMNIHVISDLLDSAYWQNMAEYMSKGFCSGSAEMALSYRKQFLEQMIAEYAGLVGAKTPSSAPVAIPVTWPEGTYSLAKPSSGCPSGDFSWYEGWRAQDTETQTPDNAWSDPNHFDAMLAPGEFTLKYCTKGVKTPTDFDRAWPKGAYCTFKYGACPTGFAEGYVKWDDEDSMNKNNWEGVLPDGVYDEDTLQRFCCRADALPTEAIILPTDSPFYLFQYKNDVCQTVANMRVTEEYLRWDDEDFLTPSKSQLGSVHPNMEFWNEPTGASGSEIYYCYYEPLV